MLLTVVEFLGFGWRDPAGVVVVDAPVVEPVDPFQGGELEVAEAPPGAAVADEFGLVEPDDRLGQRVVVALSGQSGPVVREALSADRGQLALRCKAPDEARLVQELVKRLRDAMGDRGLEKIEELSGVNKTSISRLLRGESWGTLPVIARLEQVLGEDLWGDEHR